MELGSSDVGRQEGLKNKIEKVNVVVPKAEDEIVAIIMSAIMGNIIERWELCPPKGDWTRVDVPSYCKEQSSNMPDRTKELISDPGTSVATDNRKYSLQTSRTLGKSITMKAIGKEELINHSHIDSVTEESNSMPGSNAITKLHGDDSTSLQIPRVSEVQNHLDLQVLKSLFEPQKEKIFGWEFLEGDSDVIIEFKQGNRYEGKLSRCRMNGMGKFFWNDGSVYEGEFLNGEMTGKGRLQWSDQSWYEGQLSLGYRHGLGLFVQRPWFYYGNWKCGIRNGLGNMFYNDANTQIDYYRGDWAENRKSGSGMRSYPSGAAYSGQWKSGIRGGFGTMVWTNNDVYSGNWKKGQIHGYGEYTWATFFNNQLVVPQEDCYYGNWVNGARHGNGTLETSMGVTVHGTWKNDKKHGAAEVICNNGSFIKASDLLVDDCIRCLPEVNTESSSYTDTTKNYAPLYKIPVNAANHEIDLKYYTERLNNYIANCKKNGKIDKTTPKIHFKTSPIFSNEFNKTSNYADKSNLNVGDNKLDNEQEENLLRNIILQNLSALNVIYTKYSEMCCIRKPTFSTVLMRLMLWQLLRDCNLHTRDLSLADYDILIANNKVSLVQGVHYPFERLQFWQFLHCIIEISWELYGKRFAGTTSIPGVLASALHRLIVTDIFPNAGQHKGKALFKHRNLLSLDSVYWFYRGIGEPHSVRWFLRSLYVSSDESSVHYDYQRHLVHGKNTIGVGGKLTYIPEEETLLRNTKHCSDGSHLKDLTSLRDIGLYAVFNTLLEVCPCIASNGLIVNIDYKLIFLEFYEVLLLCSEQIVKLNKLKIDAEILDKLSEDKLGTEAEKTEEAENLISPKENLKSTKAPKAKKKKK